MKFHLVLALVAALLFPAFAAAAQPPPNADWSEEYIGSDSGEPVLHADILKPKGTPPGVKLPVIVSVGPYFNHSGSTVLDYDPTAPRGPNDRWKDLIEQGQIFERGYALVLVDLRGFGGSEGCNDFGGPGEQADSKRAVKWAASQDWSTGKVGMWGKSYDAWTQVMALDDAPAGLAAAIIQSPIIDGYRTLYQDGVHYETGWYATPGTLPGRRRDAADRVRQPGVLRPLGAGNRTRPATRRTSRCRTAFRIAMTRPDSGSSATSTAHAAPRCR